MIRKEILRMENIVSIDSQRVALKSGRLNLLEKEIVGIAGLNYSGKTALVGAITGFLPYNDGVTYLYGKKVRITSINQAKRLGIHCIRETFSLIDEFTVEQNIRFQPLFNSGVLIKPKHRREYLQSLFDQFRIKFKFDELTGNLNQTEKILVEVMKAVFAGAKIVIFDNNLHMFGGTENGISSEFFSTLRSLDISIILIDTGVKLLKEFCDRIFVMRKGNTVGVFEKDQVNEQTIVAIMLGSNLESTDILRIETNVRATSSRIMAWEQVHYNGILNGISFSVNKNETLGILNLNKNSGDAIKDILSGTSNYVNGKISLGDTDIISLPKDKLMAMGLVVIPEEDTVFPMFTVEENIELSVIKKHSSVLGQIKKNELKFDMEQLLDAFLKKEEQLYFKQILVPKDRLTHKRIVICRALMTHPKVMLIMHPSDTMDDINMDEMSMSIRKICDFDCSVIVVSMDVGFLIGTCSRILVINKGIVDADLTVNQQTYNQILHEYGINLTNL